MIRMRILAFAFVAFLMGMVSMGCGATETADPDTAETTEHIDEEAFVKAYKIFAPDTPEEKILRKGYEVCKSLDTASIEEIVDFHIDAMSSPDDEVGQEIAIEYVAESMTEDAIQYLCPRHTDAWIAYDNK